MTPGRMLIFGERRLPTPQERIKRRPVLGGLLNEYERTA
jgi:hypothetical protein